MSHYFKTISVKEFFELVDSEHDDSDLKFNLETSPMHKLRDTDVETHHVKALLDANKSLIAYVYYSINSEENQCENPILHVQPQHRSKGFGFLCLRSLMEDLTGQGVERMSISFTKIGATEGKLYRNFMSEIEGHRPKMKFRVFADEKYQVRDWNNLNLTKGVTHI